MQERNPFGQPAHFTYIDIIIQYFVLIINSILNINNLLILLFLLNK